jgi:hypothetical protein
MKLLMIFTVFLSLSNAMASSHLDPRGICYGAKAAMKDTDCLLEYGLAQKVCLKMKEMKSQDNCQSFTTETEKQFCQGFVESQKYSGCKDTTSAVAKNVCFGILAANQNKTCGSLTDVL